MDVPSLCLLLATLSVSPDRSQFFRYDRVVLSCVSNSSGWTVKRSTQKKGEQSCGNGWSDPENSSSSCTIQFTYPSHTGVYWCESKHGCSDRVNLTVAARSVILESPAHGVTQGDNITLRCSYKKDGDPQPTPVFNASFFKDGVLTGTDSRGTLTLRGVSTADQGSYMCKHPTRGESAQSWLSVRGRAGTPPAGETPGGETPGGEAPLVPWTRVVCGLLLLLLYSALLVLGIYAFCQWRRAKEYTKNVM